MPILLSRIVALFLVPCLIADPASASAFCLPLSPTWERAACPPKPEGRRWGVRGASLILSPAPRFFEEQAIVSPFVDALKSILPHPAARTIEVQDFKKAVAAPPS